MRTTAFAAAALLTAGAAAFGVARRDTPVPPPIDGPGSTYAKAPRASVPNTAPLPYGLALMDRFDLLPMLRDTKCVMDASYDHSGGNGDADHFLRREGNKAILSDIRGPGCIYRFWSANAAGHLKIFFDGEDTPRIDCQMQDFFTGKVAPFVTPIVGHRSGGWYSFFPMPFQKGCHIEVTDPGGMYYHVQYQLFPDGTKVDTYSPHLTSQDQQHLSSIVSQWQRLGEDPKPTVTNPAQKSGHFSLKPGVTRSFANLTGSGVVQQIRMKITPATRATLRQTVLRVYWDGAKKPAIEAPVGDFFGVGFGDQRYRALPSAMTDTDYVVYWPMPFGKSARFELTNYGKTPIGRVDCTIEAKREPDALKNAGYFHAQWHRQTTVAGEHYHILEMNGRGQYVGEHTDMQGDRGIGFLEGDEKIYTDADTFPSIHGTGTEDFYTGGWYFDQGPFNVAYHGCSVKSDEFSRISAYRYQITDCVPFQKHIKVDIEHGGTNDYPGAAYSSVAYWYLDSPAHDWSPIKPDQLTPAHIKVDNVLEAEGLSWSGGKTAVVSDDDFRPEASGGKLVTVPAGESSFKFTASASDYYRFVASAISGPNSASAVQVLIDGNPIETGDYPDLQNPARDRGDVSAVIQLMKGEHVCTLRVPGGKSVYLDYVRLEASKKERMATEVESLIGSIEKDAGSKLALMPASAAFSGYGAIRWSPADGGSYLKIPVNVSVDGDYSLEVGVGRQAASITVTGSVDADSPGVVVDASEPGQGRRIIRLGDNLHLTAGAHTVTLFCKSDRAASEHRTLILDFVRVMRVRYAYTVEGESLKILDHHDGDVSVQGMTDFGADWSGDSQLWFTGNKKGAEVSLELPVQADGTYNLAAYFTTAGDYGIVQVLLDGKEVGDPVDCFSQGVLPKGRSSLGHVTLTKGAHRITFRAVDKNPMSANYLIGVDAIGLEPVK